MDRILKDLRDRPITIVIFFLLIIIVVVFLIDRAFFASRRKKSEFPCYNQKLVIWSPIPFQEFRKAIKSVNKYCLTVNVEKKSLEEIKETLLLETAAGRGPDIVYVDNEFAFNNLKIFDEYKNKKLTIDNYPEIIFKPLNNKFNLYPLTFDTLVLFVNNRYLANAGLYEPPKTFEEIEQAIPQLRQANFNYLELAPIALGKSNIDNFVEIFLVINKNLNQESEKNSSAFEKTFDYLTQFTNPYSNLYSWDDNLPNALLAFAQERLIMLPAFYSQKKKIIDSNSRLEFSVAGFPKFSQSLKKYNYLKVYYLGVIKNKKSKYSWLFLEEFDKIYPEFAKRNNLIPLRKDLFNDLDKESKIVINEMLIGDYFTNINYDELNNALPKYFDSWLTNKDNLKNILRRTDIFKFFKK